MKYLIGLALALAMAPFAGAANAQDETWNAIALDMAGANYLVTGAATEDDARQQAVDTCGSASCEAVLATTSPCVSIADTLEGNYQYGWSFGNTEEGVRLIALGYCIESGYGGCETRISQCIAPVEATAPVTPGPGPKTKTKG